MMTFDIGDRVTWQCRNQHGTPNFFSYEGEIVNLEPLTARFRFTGRDDWGKQTVKTAECVFRQLKNGEWIARQEHRDDAKGRLWLRLVDKTRVW